MTTVSQSRTMTGKPHHCEVFYIDPENGWALSLNDADGNQIGDLISGRYWTECAVEWQKHFSNFECRIFNKNGDLAITKEAMA